MAGFRAEFRLRNFGFGDVSDRELSVPQARWCYQPFTWLLYRFAAAIYFIVWLFVVISYWGPPYSTQRDTKARWALYVSNWSYVLLCLYLWMSAISTLLYHKKTHFKVSSATDSDIKPESIKLSTTSGTSKETPSGHDNKGHQADELDNPNNSLKSKNNVKQDIESAKSNSNELSLSWYFKATWLLQNICFAAALFVAILFWAIDFDYVTGTVTVFTLHIHGVNLIFVILDQFLIGSPYRLLHFIYPTLMAFSYFIFTLIYYAAGGLNGKAVDPVNGNTYFYKDTLDWGRHPTKSGIVMVLVVLVAAPVIHLLFFGLHHLRRSLKRCCRCCGIAN